MAKRAKKKSSVKPPEEKDKGGQPPRKFSKKELESISKLAFLNCHIRTIADKLGIDESTLRKNSTSANLIKKRRVDRRIFLREQQTNKAKAGHPAMLIFLGKDELGQQDKVAVDAHIKSEPVVFNLIINEPEDKGDKEDGKV